MTPPPALGAGFAAVIAEALTWTPDRRDVIESLVDDSIGDDLDTYDQAVDRIDEALRLARLDWSCAFGEPDALPEAGPYLDTLREHHLDAAAAVAAAVLARDLRIVTEADFTTVTRWWPRAGLTMPEPHHSALQLTGPNPNTVLWATDAGQVERHARELDRDSYRVPGWPLNAVAALGVPVLDGRYDGVPGLSWYRDARAVGAAALAVGDYLDTDDRSGCRRITSIPFSQPTTNVRVVLIGVGEPLTLDLHRRYRVVDPATLVDIDVERPFVFRGGPRDGQVTYQPRAAFPQHCMPSDNNGVDMLTWAAADAWPADVERYAYSGENDGEAALMDWRTPTPFELDLAGRARVDQRSDAELMEAMASDGFDVDKLGHLFPGATAGQAG